MKKHSTENMLHLLYIIAITAEAMTAALSAGRRSMDWIGVLIVAWVTALGGGTVRNILLGHYPMSWVEHPVYLLITASGSLLAALIARFMSRLKKLFLYLDAIGLVVFTVIGCRVAQDMNLSFVIIVISGMVTGCAGGVLRDVLCNEVPLLFRKEIYATASILTGIVYLLVEYFGGSVHLATILACAIGLLLRLLAIKYEWEMPKFIYREAEAD